MIQRLFLIICFLLFMCKGSVDDNLLKEGYIVGFEPCSYQHHYKIGYAIITTNLKDTLMTYNLPDSIYTFPSEYFNNYVNTGYFPSNARYEFKIKFSCTIAKGDEIIYNLCTTDINRSEFYRAVQVIMSFVSKE